MCRLSVFITKIHSYIFIHVRLGNKCKYIVCAGSPLGGINQMKSFTFECLSVFYVFGVWWIMMWKLKAKVCFRIYITFTYTIFNSLIYVLCYIVYFIFGFTFILRFTLWKISLRWINYTPISIYLYIYIYRNEYVSVWSIITLKLMGRLSWK